MKTLGILLLFSVVLLNSCTDLDNYTPTNASKKIEGQWTIERVRNKVKLDGKLGKNDVTNNYEGWVFNFEEGGYATLYIPNENLFMDGGWEVYETVEYNNDGEPQDHINLYMYFWDPNNTSEYKEITWTDMTVSSRKFRAREEREIDGESTVYFFELTR